MKILLKGVLFVLVLWGIARSVELHAQGKPEKVKSDKERITQLETQVQALQIDLAGAHEWAAKVNEGQDILNERTLDLNQRLRAVETRGPVAELRQ